MEIVVLVFLIGVMLAVSVFLIGSMFHSIRKEKKSSKPQGDLGQLRPEHRLLHPVPGQLAGPRGGRVALKRIEERLDQLAPSR